jgi:hypothetical protein
MTTLQPHGLAKVIRTWCPLWSDQDNQGWLRHWKAHAPGGPEAALCHDERIYRGAPLAIPRVAIPRQSVQPKA